MSAAVQTALAVIGLLVAVSVIANWKEITAPPLPLSERIAKACKEEFRHSGEWRIAECTNQTMLRRAVEIEREKLDSAYSRSR